VEVADNGQEAVQAAFANDYDALLMDIHMPQMDGYQASLAIRQEEDETKGLAYGAVDYITKPFSLPIVRARVKTHLELKRHRDTLEALSTRDGLTGIHNRRFDEVLTIEWLRGQREGTPMSLIMVDIDHFKLYNDNYGHIEGRVCPNSSTGPTRPSMPQRSPGATA
jgi:PleD family two-component response regulator